MELTRDQIHSVSPDRYNIPTSMDFNAKITMKGRHNFEHTVTDTPGPGQYRLPCSSDASVKIQLKGRTQTGSINTNPGPGAYEVGRNNHGKIPVQMKSRTAIINKNDNPAPNKYNLQGTSTAHDITLKSRPRESDQPSLTDFNYTPQRLPTDYGKVTFKSRHNVNDNESKYTPGPSDYQHTTPKYYKTDVTLKSRYDIKQDINMVGPGQYDPDTRFTSKSVTYNNIKLKGRYTPTKTQGTDAFYDLPSCFGGTKDIKLKGRTSTSAIQQLPGPGAYSPKYRNDLDRDVKFGGRTVKPGTLEYELKAKDTPGPIYNIPSPSRTSRDITIKVSKAPLIGSPNPGPGTYEVNDTFKNTQIGTKDVKILERSPPRRLKLDNVGPGSYDLDQGSYKRAQSHGITMGQRTKGYVIGRIK